MEQSSIQTFLNNLEMDGMSPNTLKAYRSDLMGALTWETQDFQTKSEGMTDQRKMEALFSMGLRAGLMKGWAIRTHNRKLACYRCYGRWLGWPDFLTTYKRPPSPQGFPHPLPEGVDGVLKMIEAARSPSHKALVTLNGLCGLRVSEARDVKPSDIDIMGDRVLLTVLGKGQKTRVIPLSDTVILALLPRLREVHGTDEALVPISDRPARLAISRIGYRALGRDDVASHDLRMTAGTAFFNKCRNIRTVQELLGHSSSSTTEIYTFVSEDQKAEAADIG